MERKNRKKMKILLVRECMFSISAGSSVCLGICSISMPDPSDFVCLMCSLKWMSEVVAFVQEVPLIIEIHLLIATYYKWHYVELKGKFYKCCKIIFESSWKTTLVWMWR